jgi:charged multivesicular body protein 3
MLMLILIRMTFSCGVLLSKVREAAKRGDMGSAKTLAREIVRTKKVINRLYVNNAHLVAMVSLTILHAAYRALPRASSKGQHVMG